MVAALQPQLSSDKHRLIEIDEACKITRKAKPTIYTLARKGLIPAYKRGKKLYFYEDELLQWIESGRKQMRAIVTSGTGCGDSSWSESANQREAITCDLHGYGNFQINSRRYYRRGCAYWSKMSGGEFPIEAFPIRIQRIISRFARLSGLSRGLCCCGYPCGHCCGDWQLPSGAGKAQLAGKSYSVHGTDWTPRSQ